MHQAFTRIEAGDQNYYLLTNLFEGGKNGLDLTVCNGEQVWRETGKVFYKTRQDKTMLYLESYTVLCTSTLSK